MRSLARSLLAGFIISTGALTVAGCGGQTITLPTPTLQTITARILIFHSPFTVVATGTVDGINQVKAQANALGQGEPNALVSATQVLDGDRHEGNKICETDVTSKGQTYHIVVYSYSAFTAKTCDGIKASGGFFESGLAAAQ